MKRQKLILIGIGCLTGMLGACSSEEATPASGMGTLALEVQAETGFRTKALNEADYQNRNNYTVTIYDEKGLYREYGTNNYPPATLEVPAGTYYFTAHCGEEVAASTETMYVEGTSNSVIVTAGGEMQTMTAVCKPTCAKVIVKFGEDMDKYFSDYSVIFRTKALEAEAGTYTWAKEDADPLYLKVDENETITATITLTNAANGTSSEVNKEYELSPNTGQTINIAPVLQDTDGSVGISIEIDSSTNDHEIDIEVPEDWV